MVMDNASYHSRRTEDYPTSKWQKAQYQDWVTTNGIPWEADLHQPELRLLVKKHRPRDRYYVCDQLAEQKGHKVLQLPPYQLDLNPIELVWAQVKGYVAGKNTSYTLKEVRSLLNDAFATVKPDS